MPTSNQSARRLGGQLTPPLRTDAIPQLADNAHEQLLSMIHRRELQSGEAIRERQLAEHFGISRTPLREALRRLEGERWLKRDLNGRLVVGSMSVRDAIEVLDVRMVLEPQCVRLATSRMQQAQIDRLRQRLVSLRKRGHITQEADGKLDDDLHNTIAMAGGNAMMAAIIANLRLRTRMFSIVRLPQRAIPVCDEHLRIIDAIDARDPEAAAKAMHAHIGGVKDAVVAALIDSDPPALLPFRNK